MLEIFLDASQLETFEPCPRKWYYSHVLNLVPLRSRAAFDIGSYYHEVLGTFYSSPLKDPIEKLKSIFDFAAQPTLFAKYHIKDMDAQKFHRKRLTDYFNHWAAEDETMETIAVEQGFSYLLYEDDNRRYILEGRIDLVDKCSPYGLNVMDHKTQSRKDDKYPFNHQVCNYLSYMEYCKTPANYFVYNYIGLQDKLPPDGFRRVIYKPPEGMLDQWKKEVKRTFDKVHNIRIAYNFQGEFSEIPPEDVQEEWYQRRRSACDSSKYGLCQFHKLCGIPDDSKYSKAVMSHYKVKEEIWRAWT